MGLFVIAYGRSLWPGRKWTHDMGGLARWVDYTGAYESMAGRKAGRTERADAHKVDLFECQVAFYQYTALIKQIINMNREKINHMVVRFLYAM